MGHMHLCNAPSINNNYLVNVDNFICFKWSRQDKKENYKDIKEKIIYGCKNCYKKIRRFKRIL
ncbi:MAG: hypothetical protein NSGCLCUN01_04043 [uncultured Clostridium sp.]